MHRLFRVILSFARADAASREPSNYGKLLLFDRSESVYFIDKLPATNFSIRRHQGFSYRQTSLPSQLSMLAQKEDTLKKLRLVIKTLFG